MGGGDLNLKKSWHPSTLRNIERVWKAEQKHEVEKQKIEQLQKELAEERSREEIQTYAEDQGVVKKKEQRLDWMYQGPSAMVNREEYLLGKKIDKTFETVQELERGGPSKDQDRDIGTTMFSSQDLSGTATVDLATKIREDPLFNIMKKEKEERKNLLQNPVKMKQLQQLLEASLKSKKSKKSKKNKKKKHQDSDDSDAAPRKHKKRHEKQHLSDSESEKFHSKYSHQHKTLTDRKSHQKEKMEYYNHKPSSSESFRKRSHSHIDDDDQEPDYPASYHRTSKNSLNGHSSRDVNDRESRHRSPSQKSYNSSSNGKSETTYKSRYSANPSKPEQKRRIDAGERERLLKEMQDNAKWRDDQRKRNTQRYREEDEREEKANSRIDTADFVKPMLSNAAGKGSLENRVKQKLFSIQRNSSAMDKNFARRE